MLGGEVIITKLSGTDLGHKNLLFFSDDAALTAIPFVDTEDTPGDECDGESDDDDDDDDDDTDDPNDDCNCRTAPPGIPAWPALVLLSLIAALGGRRREGGNGRRG